MLCTAAHCWALLYTAEHTVYPIYPSSDSFGASLWAAKAFHSLDVPLTEHQKHAVEATFEELKTGAVAASPLEAVARKHRRISADHRE